MLASLSYQSLSQEPGIYLFLDKKGNVLYVGKAKNLKKRVSSYFLKSITLGPKTKILVSKIAKIETIIVRSEIEALLLEANYIKKYKPKYNTRFIDGKNYPLIRITVKNQSPSILIARRQDDKKSVYFGPFPNSSAMKMILKIIRKIFPYQSAPNHSRRICLYYHLGLCPCPPVFSAKGGSKEFRKEYRKNIKYIINFLQGKTKKVLKELEKEKNILSKNEEFEKASVLQKKINAINILTDPAYKNYFDYKISPIHSLRKTLNKSGMKIKNLSRIECYDISNISGTNATGSMVVFTDGGKDSQWYRRFRIRLNQTPNDFAMIREVLERRFRHPEWPYPDLIIIDGGKGQVSSALKVLAMKQFSNSTIPVIGLAKQFETIITSDFREISLPKNLDALKLVMRIRDEAHRFAITYHRKLRSKNFIFE